jgi:hypothetical protein
LAVSRTRVMRVMRCAAEDSRFHTENTENQ